MQNKIKGVIICDEASPMDWKEVIELYKLQNKEIEIEGETKILYGAATEDGFFFDFAADAETAREIVDLLNENEVEPCHAPEIIEDLFYSCR